MTAQSDFCKLGKDVTIWPLAKLIDPHVISIGNSVIIDDNCFIMGGQRTDIGSFIHIAAFSLIVGGGEFVMEDFATISGGVKIYTGNDDYLGNCMVNSSVPYPFRRPLRSFVHIHKHAVIGANSVVLPPAVIGEGTVVGANSLVKGNLEPWTIYVGSPAKPIRQRPSHIILELERELRAQVYTANGEYIPRDLWPELTLSPDLVSIMDGIHEN